MRATASSERSKRTTGDLTVSEREDRKGGREKLASRLGFILLSAGCAIGIGNVWRFPYVAGRSGGGWFVAIYFICLALLGIPVLTMEFAAGRAAQRSIAKIHETLTPKRRAWRFHGLLGSLALMILMMFYTTVTAWMVIYFFKTACGSFAGLTPEQVGAAFGGPGGMLSDPITLIYVMTGVCLSAVGICAIGIQKGLERVTKWLMLALLVLIVALAFNSLTLKGAMEGVRFYLVPNLENVRKVGLLKVIVEAMNQAFFTLSLGIGSMAIFGSYIGKDRSLLGESLHVAALDTVVAIAAGLIILPACFAFGLEPGQGPGLVFVTLPNVFNQMSGGRFWGSLFFLFMSCAALTTVLAVFEGIIASVRDFTGWGRGQACALLAVAIPYLSVPCILGFNLWKGFEPLGPGTCVLDLEDFVVSNVALPLGGLLFVLYCCHRFGWGWRNFLAETNAGHGVKLPAFLRGYCAYVLPVIVGSILVLGLLRKFCGIEI